MADAIGSGPIERNLMEVQILLTAPNKNKTNLEAERFSHSKFVLFFNNYWFGVLLKQKQ